MNHGEILRQILDEKNISPDQFDKVMGGPMSELYFKKDKLTTDQLTRICGKLGINKSIFAITATPSQQLTLLIEDFHSMRVQMEILAHRMDDIEKTISNEIRNNQENNILP